MGKALRVVKGWLSDAFGTLFPETCLICNRRLNKGEKYICTPCFHGLPFTGFHGKAGNITERLFWDALPIVRANSYLYYNVGADSRRPFFWLKYYNLPELGVYLGRIMARDVIDAGFFEGIDVIVPLPLSKEKLRERGYNQSLQLSEGISQITGIPVNDKAVIRIIDNPTQTQLTSYQRRNNVKGIFKLEKPENLAGKHILLVDDIVTTNATLTSCGKEIASNVDVRISILTLGIAGSHSFASMSDR